MASANTSWSEENFSCPICLDVFSSPVSTPCGHNFCRTCINKFWDEQVQCKCPICNKMFDTRPDPQVNIFETLNMEMKKLRDDAELKRVQQYEVDVTLDPDTAHPKLFLSEDGKQVHDGGVRKELPDNPKRFTWFTCAVLTRQSFSSGRFYFEVQVKDKTVWGLGVARESIDKTRWTRWTPETGYWTLDYNKDKLVFNDNPDVRLPLRARLQKVGVFVDYDEGLLSFYDVEARVHIYSATGCAFTEPLYPILYPGLCEGGTNSAPLIISHVNQTD
uniref:Uncharacterized protein n=1 Tax=Gadus morhua TaxID=8049 RepID=A0A8C5C7A1_GADMO